MGKNKFRLWQVMTIRGEAKICYSLRQYKSSLALVNSVKNTWAKTKVTKGSPFARTRPG
jgi:hypothetical protein